MILDWSYGTFEQGHSYLGMGWARTFHSESEDAPTGVAAYSTMLPGSGIGLARFVGNEPGLAALTTSGIGLAKWEER